MVPHRRALMALRLEIAADKEHVQRLFNAERHAEYGHRRIHNWTAPACSRTTNTLGGTLHFPARLDARPKNCV